MGKISVSDFPYSTISTDSDGVQLKTWLAK